MNWKSHMVFGIAFTIGLMFLINLIIAINQGLFAKDVIFVLFPLNSLVFWVYSIPIMMIYSLLPDIDHKNSKITTFFFGIGFIIIALSYITSRYLQIETIYDFGGMVMYGIVLMLSTWIFSRYFKHRSVTHTIWFGLFATIVLLLVGIQYIIYYLIAFISFWSHLVIDGIPFKISAKANKKY